MALSPLSVHAGSYGGAVKSNLWGDASNPAGIRQQTGPNASYAELYGGYTGGGFKSSSQALDAWNAGAKAATLVHYDRYSMKGSFSFEQFHGWGMAGSMFITPSMYPVDVIEFTPGEKTRQTYTFSGSFSADLSDSWRLGAGMEFLSANYAKLKDVRHTNYRLDMTVTPGVLWHEGDFALGFNYIFHKESETVDAEQVGTGQESYYAFLDKGILYGKYEIWNGSGTHLDEAGVNGFPVAQTAHGAAVQMSKGGFFTELKYLHTNGKVGEKQQIWYRYGGDELQARLLWRFSTSAVNHRISCLASWKSVTNNETVLEKVNEGGITTVREYGANEVYTRSFTTVEPRYEISAGTFSAEAVLTARHTAEIATPMYPYIYLQDTYTLFLDITARKTFGHVTTALGMGFGDGYFTDSGKLSSETSGVTGEPYRLEGYWSGMMDYIVAKQLRLTPSVTYGFSNGLYLRLAGRFVKAFELQVIKKTTRYDANLTLGYNF